MDQTTLINITLICAIVALILACIIPAVLCYFGCICSCCCYRAKENLVLEKQENDGSVRYSVRSTRSKSQSKSTDGGSHHRSKRSGKSNV